MLEAGKRWVQDVAVSLGLLFIGMMGTGPAGNDEPAWTREPDVWAYVLVAGAALSLIPRRRYPALVLVASGAFVGTYLAVGYPFGPIMLTIPVVGYTVGSLLPLRRAVGLAAVYYLGVLTIMVIRFSGEEGNEGWLSWAGPVVASLAIFAAPVAIGAALRIRRESERGVRTEQARRAVSEERLRMAQELHDSVGHGLAVIAMQAGVALHVLERNPEKVRAALEAIRDTSRESLDGLRAELRILRAPDDGAPRRPSHGLAEAGVLIERIRASGVEVRTEIADIDGPLGESAAGGAELPPDVDVAAYRILQESLTNVLRHADASWAEVRIRRDGEAVVIDVTDNGIGRGRVGAASSASGLGGTDDGDAGSPGTGAPGSTGTGDPGGLASEPGAAADAYPGGTGISGMRARAESLGGSLEAGPRPGGGFAVHARLPVAGHAPELGQMPETRVPGSTT